MDTKQLTERQAQIVDAAMQIIAMKGSRRFTAARLASQVGLTGGALYRHFNSMDEVVDAIVDRVGGILFDGFPPQAEDPVERLKQFFYHRVRTILGHPHISRLLLSDHLAQAGGVAQSKRLDEYKRRSQEFVMACLKEASHAGMLIDGTSPEACAIVVLGSVLALSHTTPRIANSSDNQRLCDEVWAGIEAMLRQRQMAAKPMAGPAHLSLKGPKS